MPRTEQQDLPGGVVHDLPGDFEAALRYDPAALATWTDITPLARNEWICWIEFGQEARDPAQADRLGRRQPERWQAPPVLLAGMSASLRLPAHRRRIDGGGEGGIRTHGGLAPTAVFKTAALNHSATSPHVTSCHSAPPRLTRPRAGTCKAAR